MVRLQCLRNSSHTCFVANAHLLGTNSDDGKTFDTDQRERTIYIIR